MTKTVGIGVTGGIAAYKIADLVSRLKKDDIDVIVMMTESAQHFVAPLTFKTLSGREVLTDLWQDSHEWKVQHVGIAEELDLLVIAPATASIIGKMAHGIADDLLSTVYLANSAPVLVVPAMNSNMYRQPVVQENLRKLKGVGCHVMQPGEGYLACGATGPGRLPEVEEIYQRVVNLLFPRRDLAGKRIMVNAGSTCEDIDPVRFISNRGTGKMGYCIAEEAAGRGAEVILVSGPTHLDPPVGVHLINVWDAEEMCRVMLENQARCDAIIGSAAVADYRMANKSQQKIKKTENQPQTLILELIPNPDILKELGKNKNENQIMVGFAAETENLLENAAKKLASKNLDFIVANDITMEGAGFASDTNIVSIISRSGDTVSLPKMSKYDVAAAILNRIAELLI
ncbi:MAG TPA: bifunctional phosphopantothenoylcysteine decarboxylase/phosphopantothenate--cysteine ligase CoaBC [Syntrophomonadaceae bacterium]|nr:bifunctional phosphopantothenoylcysteine decarboxylase/phosphopantothenate--cysteine ligase CoaBC [Syntrophomonadaceae bacterium]